MTPKNSLFKRAEANPPIVDEPINICLLDANFSKPSCSSCYDIKPLINWERRQPRPGEICVVTDHLVFNSPPINTIAWLVEPAGNGLGLGLNAKPVVDYCRWVLTYNRELLEFNDKCLFCPCGGCWLRPDEQRIYSKSKLCSIIASRKTGHNRDFRHQIINKYGSQMDVFGGGYNPIRDKITALKDYAFSIVIECAIENYYFSEKLIDAFRTGTVPIYSGCPSIGRFFNLDGMILIKNLEEAADVIAKITMDQYLQMLPAIIDNFARANEYVLVENYMLKHYRPIFKNGTARSAFQM